MELLDRFKAQQEHLKPRYERMDLDMGLYLLSKYTFEKAGGGAIADAESVTTNDPRVFADFVISILASTDRKYIISGDKLDTNNLAEKFIRFAITRANEQLGMQGEYDLDYSIDWNSCLRGTACVIALLKRDGNKYEFDIQLPDARSVVYETGRQGCLYAGVSTVMTNDIIERDYKYVTNDKESNVYDIWTKDEHVVYVGNKQILKVTHRLGVNPFIVIPVSTSSRFTHTTSTIEHQAESIYAGARDLYTLLNRHMSAWATSNVRSTLRAAIFKSDRMDELEAPPTQSNAVAKIGLDEGLDLFPVADFSTSHQSFIAQILQEIQRATVTNLSLGELKLHGMSALALKELGKSKDRTFVPRVKAKNMLFTSLGYSLIKQFVNGGYPTDLENGEEIDFEPSSFANKKFTIKIEHYTERPEESIANMTLAANAKAIGLPDKYIADNVLKVDDYREIEYQRGKEQAITEVAELRFLYEARALIQTGDEYDKVAAALLLRKIGMELRGNKIVPSAKLKQTASPAKPAQDLTGMPAMSQPVKDDDAAMIAEEARREGVSAESRRV